MPGNTEKTKKLSDNLKNNVPADYTPPEVLYDELLDTIRRYHPLREHIRLPMIHMLDSSESPASHILFTLFA